MAKSIASEKIDNFMKSVIVTWFEKSLEIIDEKPKVPLTYDVITDGILIHRVFCSMKIHVEEDHIEPSEGQIIKSGSNLKKILNNIYRYHEVENDRVILKMPYIDRWIKDPSKNTEEIENLLYLLLGCAILCSESEKFLKKIQDLDESVQISLDKCITMAIKTPDYILCREMFTVNDEKLRESNVNTIINHVSDLNTKVQFYEKVLRQLLIPYDIINEEDFKLHDLTNFPQDPNSSKILNLNDKIEFSKVSKDNKDSREVDDKKNQKKFSEKEIKFAKIHNDELDVKKKTPKVVSFERKNDDFEKKVKNSISLNEKCQTQSEQSTMSSKNDSCLKNRQKSFSNVGIDRDSIESSNCTNEKPIETPQEKTPPSSEEKNLILSRNSFDMYKELETCDKMYKIQLDVQRLERISEVLLINSKCNSSCTNDTFIKNVNIEEYLKELIQIVENMKHYSNYFTNGRFNQNINLVDQNDLTQELIRLRVLNVKVRYEQKKLLQLLNNVKTIEKNCQTINEKNKELTLKLDDANRKIENLQLYANSHDWLCNELKTKKDEIKDWKEIYEKLKHDFGKLVIEREKSLKMQNLMGQTCQKLELTCLNERKELELVKKETNRYEYHLEQLTRRCNHYSDSLKEVSLEKKQLLKENDHLRKQNHELSSKFVEECRLFHQESRINAEKIKNLIKVKERLEEKIIEQHKQISPDHLRLIAQRNSYVNDENEDNVDKYKNKTVGFRNAICKMRKGGTLLFKRRYSESDKINNIVEASNTFQFSKPTTINDNNNDNDLAVAVIEDQLNKMSQMNKLKKKPKINEIEMSDCYNYSENSIDFMNKMQHYISIETQNVINLSNIETKNNSDNKKKILNHDNEFDDKIKKNQNNNTIESDVVDYAVISLSSSTSFDESRDCDKKKIDNLNFNNSNKENVPF